MKTDERIDEHGRVSRSDHNFKPQWVLREDGSWRIVWQFAWAVRLVEFGY